MFHRQRCACRYRRSRADSKKAPALGRANAPSPPRRVLAEPLPARAPALRDSRASLWANLTSACLGLASKRRAFNLVRLKTKQNRKPSARRKGQVDERDQYRRSRPVDPRRRRGAGAHRRRAGGDRRRHFRSGARRRPDPRDIARGRTRIVDRRAGTRQDQARRDAWGSSLASTRCGCSSRPI